MADNLFQKELAETRWRIKTLGLGKLVMSNNLEHRLISAAFATILMTKIPLLEI